MRRGKAVNAVARVATLALLLLICVIPVLGGDDEIPITTSSKEALTHFTTGRDLADQAHAEEARAHFEKAIALDPGFALAYYQLAMASNTGPTFLENLKQAVAKSNKVSEGERLIILALQADVEGNTMKEKNLLEDLVKKYPKDKRSHFILGTFLTFTQQDYKAGIEEFNSAIAIAPTFSPAFNLLGYANRDAGNLPEAEHAFKRYTELVPNEANAHDSYAELLMKEGKFDESIKEYEKAISIDPHMYSSYIGVATNNVFKGMPVEARAELQKLYDLAPDDGVREQALSAMTATYLDEGKFDKALAEMQKRYAIAEKSKDPIAMFESLNFMGDILLESAEQEAAKSTALKLRDTHPQMLDEAASDFQKAHTTINESNVSADIKANANQEAIAKDIQIAVRKGDFTTAQTKVNEYRKQAEARGSKTEIQTAHQLAGTIALHEKKFDDAVKELQQANLRNPRNLYLLARAFEGAGNKEKAAELWSKLSSFNEIGLNYAFVRNKIQKE